MPQFREPTLQFQLPEDSFNKSNWSEWNKDTFQKFLKLISSKYLQLINAIFMMQSDFDLF